MPVAKRFSSQAWLYQPARPTPICTSQGQTLAADAWMVSARVETERASGVKGSPGSVMATSASVAPQRMNQGRMRKMYERTRQPSKRNPATSHFRVLFMIDLKRARLELKAKVRASHYRKNTVRSFARQASLRQPKPHASSIVRRRE